MEGADCEYEEEITDEEGDAGHKGSDSEDSDPEDEVQTQMSEEDVSQITESLKGTIGSIVEKTRVIADAEIDRLGRKAIYVPVSAET
ncbi:hypothetical protein BGW38_005383, partial [Lunasporangiospora selenospora]